MSGTTSANVTWSNTIEAMLAPFAGCMKFQMDGKYQLDDYDNVVENGEEIWAVLNGNPIQMPPGDPLPPGQLALFRAWMLAEYPR
jgi:hypothetical protein